MKGLSGRSPYESAGETIRRRIDEGRPVAYLLLNCQSPAFDFFQRHWFLVNGYEQRGESFHIKTVTYDKVRWLPLKEPWNTGREEKGGIVIFEAKGAEQ